MHRIGPAIGISVATIALLTLLCGAKELPKTPKAKPEPELTYSKDIAPIIYDNCTSCHHTGEVAPFSLANYQEVKQHAATIVAVTQQRYMPPWKAAPDHDQFVGERRLTDTQIAELQRWADENEPEGSPADLPPAPRYANGWQLGTPDVVVQPKAAYNVAAGGSDIYRCFVIPTNYTSDRYLSAIDIHPGDSRAVHHIILYLDTHGVARQLEAKNTDGETGYTSFGGPGFDPSGALGGWAPGIDPTVLPTGDGILLPAGADIVMQVHYHKDGKPETDLTQVGLYFSKTPIDKRVRTIPIVDPFLKITPGDANYEAQAQATIPTDIHVLDVMPHMHLLGHDMTVTATPPNQQALTLVDVPDWNFNWQTRYTFKNSPALPKGTVVRLVAHYDNTDDNPFNPNTPPKLVTWGEQTTDEMCIAFLSYTVDSEHMTKGIAAADDGEFMGAVKQGVIQQLVETYDANGDGRLEPSELAHLIVDMRDLKKSPGAVQGDGTALAQQAMIFDANKDGGLDASELSTLLQFLKGGGLGAAKTGQ